ncbi:hypothetical protein [Neorhizobium sp. P12A]|uniref:hypothetical protein n=1 Tax=Neorhizobium sp. P12A TaxID=2268027 RepID=UPI00165E5058|nr:hypothetical protein [Neorhizobium sp. P12A]
MDSYELEKAVLAERQRCAEIARQYLEAVKDCTLNDDEPEKIYQAIIAGELPPELA